MKLRIDDLDTAIRLLEIKGRADGAIDGVFNNSAPYIEAEAKLNAPWRDRTGNARRTLYCGCSLKPLSKKRLAVVGQMYYSPSLELSYRGRYKILFPTVVRNSGDILHNVVRALKEVRV